MNPILSLYERLLVSPQRSRGFFFVSCNPCFSCSNLLHVGHLLEEDWIYNLVFMFGLIAVECFCLCFEELAVNGAFPNLPPVRKTHATPCLSFSYRHQ